MSIVTLLVVFGSVSVLSAQNTRAGAKTPFVASGRFAGVWQGYTQTQLRAIPEERKKMFAFTAEAPPMLPWAREKFEGNVDPTKEEPNDHGRMERDPGMHCYPPGPTWLHIQPRPFEFLELPGRIFIRYEWDRALREIWMDGREHPKDMDPTWMGHSIGRWEGDVLVVDTVGVTEKTWLDLAGHVHSDSLHIVERFWRKDQETLILDITFDDPIAYSRPWSGQRTFKLRPGFQVEEHVGCETHLIREHKLQ
jgi:hypothetical protein